MTAVHADEGVAQSALDAAFEELELVEDLMSLYRPESQISRLNRDAVLDNPHPHLVKVLQHANEIARLSAGAFDVTVQPLWQLFHEAHQRGAFPDDAALRRVSQQIDWRRIEISKDRISLHGQGTAITLNGIAQGFAADLAMQAIARHGVLDALINTGEFCATGNNPDGHAWGVGIQHPRIADALASVARLENRCLATSGDYETTFASDFTRHHLFDPHTGCSPRELSSVSVIAPTAMAADALSTTVFVLGPQRGLEFLKTFRDTEALLILKDGRMLTTPGFPAAA